MTWSSTGIWQGNLSTNLSLSNQGVGNLIVAEVINFSNSTVWCTGLSGGGVTWVQAGVKSVGSTDAMTAVVFFGTVTATGAGTATVSWSGTAPAQFGIASHEFHSTVGAWTFISQGNLDSSGTNAWPSLTAQAGDLYFGYVANATASGTTSTSGYDTTGSSADGAGNAGTFNVNCPSGSTNPTWSDSGQQFGVVVLVREGAAAAPAPPVFPAQPGATWRRLFQHRQILAPPPPPAAPAPPPPPAPPVTALPGATWLRRFQHRQILAPPVAPVQPYIAGLGGSGYSSWFTDQYGNPRLAVIEQAWALPFNAGRWNGGNWQADFTAYFSNRAAQGYTAMYGVAWGSTHVDSTALAGRSWDGVYALTVNGTPGIPSTGSETVALNAPFWDRIAAMFSTARAYGITCFLNMGLTYDFSDAGAIWQHASTTQANAFGAALAARFPQSQFPNVQWFFGDDDGGGNDSFWSNMLTGMQGAGDTRSLIAIEYLTNENSHVEFDNGAAVGTFGAASATYNWVYSYDAPYFGLERSYTEGGTFAHIPPVYGDGIYYGDSGGGPSVEYAVRSFVWWAIASGSRGFASTSGPSFGDSNALWMWASSAATTRVTSDPNGSWTTTNVGRIATYISGLADWWKLIPDTGNALVTGGRGTRGTCDIPASGFNVRTGNSYVAASVTPAGTLAVLYCRAGFTSVTIDQTRMAAGYTATWVDPSNPALTQAATPGSTYSSPGNNAAGDPDWVLVLQGSVAPAGTAPDHLVIARRQGARAVWRGTVSATVNLRPGQVQPPATRQPRRYPARALWHGWVSATTNLLNGNAPGGLVRRRASARAVIRGGPAPFPPPTGTAPDRVTVARRAPARAVWRGWVSSTVNAAPSAPVTGTAPDHLVIARRAAARGTWHGTAVTTVNTAATVSGTAPDHLVIARRAASRVVWRGQAAAPRIPAPVTGGRVTRRPPARGTWRGYVSRTANAIPPAGTAPRHLVVRRRKTARAYARWTAVATVNAPPPSFTTGALTATDTASSALTAATAPYSTLTAGTQRTGGPS